MGILQLLVGCVECRSGGACPPTPCVLNDRLLGERLLGDRLLDDRLLTAL